MNKIDNVPGSVNDMTLNPLFEGFVTVWGR